MKIKPLGYIITGILWYSASSYANEFNINEKRYAEQGDSSIAYPQVCVRTNSKVERIDLDKMLNRFKKEIIDSAVPPEKIGEELLKKITSYGASGAVGHGWMVYFKSPENGVGYGFQGVFGSAFRKDTRLVDSGESPARGFVSQRCTPLQGNVDDIENELDNISVILKEESRQMAQAMYNMDNLPSKGGYYTALTNCAWFASELFNRITKSVGAIYKQPYDMGPLADAISMPALRDIKEFPTPGMLSESNAKLVKGSISVGPDHYILRADNKLIKINDDGSIVDASGHLINPQVKPYLTQLTAAVRVNRDEFYFLYDGHVIIRDANGTVSKPQPIADVFIGIDDKENRVTAAFEWKDGFTYLIMSNGSYFRYSSADKSLDVGPVYINNSDWHGLEKYAARITSATNFKNSQLFLTLDNNTVLRYDFDNKSIISQPIKLSDYSDLFKTN